MLLRQIPARICLNCSLSSSRKASCCMNSGCTECGTKQAATTVASNVCAHLQPLQQQVGALLNEADLVLVQHALQQANVTKLRADMGLFVRMLRKRRILHLDLILWFGARPAPGESGQRRPAAGVATHNGFSHSVDCISVCIRMPTTIRNFRAAYAAAGPREHLQLS